MYTKNTHINYLNNERRYHPLTLVRLDYYSRMLDSLIFQEENIEIITEQLSDIIRLLRPLTSADEKE